MRCREITYEQEQPTPPLEQVYQFSIVILARSATRLSPFRMDKVEVHFPCLNAIVGNVRQLMLKGLGDTSQLLHVVVDVAIFHTDEMQAMNEILSAPTVDIIGVDGTLNLAEPQISLVGNGGEWI
ncbi:hypothetical protein [Terasakiella sp.]|uniref:hypothetical protein n=1 Tax=Terasakiella sp. TaxID=2034861 RepID=UPI003AA7D1BB